MSAKLKIFYHVCSLPGWKNIMTDQLSKLSESNLLQTADELNICTIGNESEFDGAKKVTEDFDNVKWHHISDRLDLMEYATLNFIREQTHLDNSEYYVLYMHQKGITRPDDLNTADWRQYLDFWSIEKWQDSIKKLDEGYDIIGTNWIDGYIPHRDDQGRKIAVWPHFSGGTWWARASYLRTLDPLLHPDSIPFGETSKLTKLEYTKENWRYDHEAWHGSGTPRHYSLDKTPGSTKYAGWHLHNRYPRSAYDNVPHNKVFDGTEVGIAPYLSLHMPRILVDRRKALGDVLMITPVLHELRNRFGKLAFIQVVTEEPHALFNNPDVNSVITPANMNKSDPWDFYINLNDAYETNPLCNYIDSYINRAFGIDPQYTKQIDRSIRIYPTTEELQRVSKIIEDEIKNNYVVVHMRRWAWENKNVDINTWGTFFALLNHYYPDLKIVSVGAQYDYRAMEIMNGIDLVDKLTVGEIAGLIGISKCFIGGDSGPFHIASATPTPIVALLSHLDAEQILPTRNGIFGKNVTVVQSDVPCAGCYKRQNPPIRNLDCENEEQWVCAKKFNPTDIFRAVEKYIK